MKKNQTQQIKDLKAQLKEAEGEVAALRDCLSTARKLEQLSNQTIAALKSELEVFKKSLELRNSQLGQIKKVFHTDQLIMELDRFVNARNKVRGMTPTNGEEMARN